MAEIKTILVIEPDEELASQIGEAIEAAGYEFLLAPSAEQGLRLLGEQGVDLVVLDLDVPNHDGIEACQKLRESGDEYVIMLSGQDSERERVRGLSAGADDFLGKPFYYSELVARIGAMERRFRAGPGPDDRAPGR